MTVAAGAPVVPLTPVVAPAETAEMDAMARRLATLIDGARPVVKPFAIDLAALPRVAMHARLDAKTAAKLDRSALTDDAPLAAKPAEGYARQYMVSFTFKDAAQVSFGRMQVQGTYGASEGWFGEAYGVQVNVYQTCGKPGDLVAVRWETVSFDGDRKNLTYTMNDGVLDRLTCKVLRARTSVAVAKPLLPGGILYGFRSCEDACTDSNEELTLLFPRAAASAAGALAGGADRVAGSFSMVSFPIQRGGGGAFLARIMKRDVTTWQIRASVPAGAANTEKPAPPLDDAARLGSLLLPSFELGVEMSQARDDEAPLVIAYMDADAVTLPAPPPPATAPTASTPLRGTTATVPTGFGRVIDLDER